MQKFIYYFVIYHIFGADVLTFFNLIIYHTAYFVCIFAAIINLLIRKVMEKVSSEKLSFASLVVIAKALSLGLNFDDLVSDVVECTADEVV